MARFQDYNAACPQYVGEMRSAIVQRGILPEFRLDQSGDQRWIRPTELAVVLFYRQLGLANLSVKHHEEGIRQVLSYVSHNLAQGTHEEIAQCISTLEALNAGRYKIDSLIAQARSIREEALRVRASLEDHLLRRRLRRRLGRRCPYM